MPDVPAGDVEPQPAPAWINEFQYVAQIAPGAFTGHDYRHPARREPLILYRCLRCWATVEEGGRAYHASFHAYVRALDARSHRIGGLTP